MAVPTLQEFLARFPEFTEQSASVVDGALAESATYTPETVWGTTHKEAIMYLTAHQLSLRTMQLGLQVGSLTGNPLGLGYDATLYGQEYKRLMRSLDLIGFAF